MSALLLGCEVILFDRQQPEIHSNFYEKIQCFV